MAPEDAPGMWELLMDKGQEEGLIPCGLGARDPLRLEASMPRTGMRWTIAFHQRKRDLGFL